MTKKNILWTTNVLLKDISSFLNINQSQSGTWLDPLLDNLKTNLINKFNFIVIHASVSVKTIIDVKIENVRYIVFPRRKLAFLDKFYKELNYLKLILSSIDVDLFHIHGFEEFYGLAPEFVPEKTVISIQGIRNEIISYLYSDISLNFHIYIGLQNETIQPIINYFQWKTLTKIEMRIINNHKNFIGHSTFDRSFIENNLKDFKYFSDCPDIVRMEFYNSKWIPHSHSQLIIHTTISESTFKGIFFLLKFAEKFRYILPSFMINVAGDLSGIIGSWFLDEIKKRKLSSIFCILGRCNALELVSSMLSSDIFILFSYIENSPLSLIEAQTLGMPVIAPYTGGIIDLIEEGRTGLFYPPGNLNLLIQRVRSLSENEDKRKELSIHSRNFCYNKHNIPTIINRYDTIYSELIQ
jgi:glycosyltransferase involved in cell wall biosynthesis